MATGRGPAALTPATEAPAPPAPVEPPRRRGASSRVALLVLAGVAAALFVREAQVVLIPVVLAGLLAVALEPVVERLERWRIGRRLGAALALGALLGAGASVLVGLNDEAVAALEELPRAAERLRAALRDARAAPPGTLEKVRDAAAGLQAAAHDALVEPASADGVVRVRVEEPPLRLRRLLVWGSIGLAELAAQGVMIVLLAYFLLVDADRLRLKLVRVAGPAFSRRRITVQVLGEIGDQLQRFLRTLALSSSLVALVTWAVLAALGLERAAFWGCAAGVLNTIPYFGALFASVGIAAASWMQTGTLDHAALAAGAALVVTFLESALLTPLLMGRAARMSQAAIFVSLLLWSWLWGIWGVLLATPMMMAVKSAADRVEGWGGLAELLSD